MVGMRAKAVRGVSLVCVVVFASSAFAQTTDPAAAQALFDEGKKLVGEGNYAEACPKFAASQRLEPAIGTLINLADCYEHAGKTASAWARYLDAATMADRANQPERAEKARGHAKDLEAKLPRLTIRVKVELDGLEVKRDGLVIESAAFGVAVPVDPGTHVLTASAPGKPTWSKTVNAKEGTTEIVELTSLDASSDKTVGSTRSDQRTVGMVLTGIGIVTLGVSAGFGLAARSKWKESRAGCNDGTVCNDEGYGLARDADRLANAATLSLIVSGIAIGTGVVLWIAAPSTKPTTSPAQGVHVAPTWMAQGPALLFSGHF